MSGDYERSRDDSSSSTLWIILGVVGAVLLVCGGLIGLAFYGVYWVGHRASVAMQDAVDQAEQARLKAVEQAQREAVELNEQFVAESAVQMFVSNLQLENYRGAYEDTSSGFKKRRTLAQFQATMAEHPELKRQAVPAIKLQPKTKPGSHTAKVILKGPRDELAFTVQLVYEAGQWKVDQVSFPQGGKP